MKIAVLGQSLPGMMAAVEAARKGHDVTLYGKAEEARSITPFGPMYLWWTPEMEAYCFNLDWNGGGGFGPDGKRPGRLFAKPKVETISVLFYINGSIDAWPNNKCSCYMHKMGQVEPPCLGKTEFTFVPGGLEMLRDCLGWELSKFFGQKMPTQIKHNVDRVFLHQGKSIVLSNGEARVYDSLINTVARPTFERMVDGREIESTINFTYFHEVVTSPYGVRPTKNEIIYDADRSNLWFRCTQTPSGTYLLEAKDLMPGIERFGLVRVFKSPAKVSLAMNGLPVRPGIHHLGRWAEMNGEIMVSDIPTRLKNLDFTA